EGGAAYERSVHVGLCEQNARILGLYGAPVEHGHLDEALDERVRVLDLLRSRGLPRADRPDGLVGDNKPVVGLEHGELPAKYFFGMTGLAFRVLFADAIDDTESSPECMLCAAPGSLVRLAEVLPPLGVADDRARDAHFEQH